MGTAFSSSLFGLAGSLALGFLDLQLGQAQNRFYKDLEEWLSGLTKLSSGEVALSRVKLPLVLIKPLFEQTAESLDRLQRVIVRNEDQRLDNNKSLVKMNDQISSVLNEIKGGNTLLHKLLETQNRLLNSIATEPSEQTEILEATKTYLKKIENTAGLLLEDIRSGRENSIDEIRQEIRLLARTIAALAEDAE